MPGDQLVHAHLDRLAERDPHPGDLGEQLLHLLDQFGLRAGLLPLLARLERQEEVRQLDAHRVGGDFGAAQPRPDVGDLILELREQQLLDAVVHHHGLLHRNPRHAHRGADDGPLAQLGQELAAHARGQECGAGQQRQGAQQGEQTEAHRQAEDRLVEAMRHPHEPRLLFLDLLRQEQTGQDRREGQRQKQRAGQREDHRQGHRLEQLTLHAFQREDGQEDDEDDAHAEGHGPRHFQRRAGQRLLAFLLGQRAPQLMLALRQAAHGILDHHHRAIDDETEVHRAQAQQAGGDAGLQHQVAGEQHRERDGGRHDQAGPQVAEEGKQNGDRPATRPPAGCARRFG